MFPSQLVLTIFHNNNLSTLPSFILSFGTILRNFVTFAFVTILQHDREERTSCNDKLRVFPINFRCIMNIIEAQLI